MRSSIAQLLFLLVTLSLHQIISVQAQFGLKKGLPISLPQQQNGEDMMGMGDEGGARKQDGFLSEQDAADMAAIIEEAKKDLETMAMITKMKDANAEEIAELSKLSTMEVLGGMKETLDNLKLVEYLFKDKDRAVREMEKEGMIEKAHIKKYRKDPNLLEQDTRRGLYFQFISLAVVGGFIE